MSAEVNDVNVHVKCPGGHDNIIPNQSEDAESCVPLRELGGG